MVHPIMVGVSGWTGYFQRTIWEPRSLPMGEIGDGRLVHARLRCLPLKGGSSLWGPSNCRIAWFGITYRLTLTQKWRNTIITLVATLESSFSLYPFFSSYKLLCIMSLSLCITWKCLKFCITWWPFKFRMKKKPSMKCCGQWSESLLMKHPCTPHGGQLCREATLDNWLDQTKHLHGGLESDIPTCTLEFNVNVMFGLRQGWVQSAFSASPVMWSGLALVCFATVSHILHL